MLGKGENVTQMAMKSGPFYGGEEGNHVRPKLTVAPSAF